MEKLMYTNFILFFLFGKKKRSTIILEIGRLQIYLGRWIVILVSNISLEKSSVPSSLDTVVLHILFLVIFILFPLFLWVRLILELFID